jgi:hypothetical protein
MRSLVLLVVLLPAIAVADTGPTATVPVMDSLADLRSCGSDVSCAMDLVLPGVEVEPGTGHPRLRIQAKGAMDVGPLLDWADLWPESSLHVKLVSSAERSGFEADLSTDLADPDAWLDLTIALELIGFDAEVSVTTIAPLELGVHPALGAAEAWIGACQMHPTCLDELRRDAPWIDPWSETVALVLELPGADDDDPRVEALKSRDWTNPPTVLRVAPDDGSLPSVRLIGWMAAKQVEELEGLEGLRSRPLAGLTPTSLQLKVVDAAADVSACGGDAACLFDMARLHDAMVSPDGHLGVVVKGPLQELDDVGIDGWLFGPESEAGISGLITFEALRELGLGRWRLDGPVLVTLDQLEEPDDDTEHEWLGSWQNDRWGYTLTRDLAPGAEPPRQERPFGLDDPRLNRWLDDIHKGLDGATPGSEIGLKMRWSSLSDTTLDGETIDDLLPGAAGSETVIGGRYRHVISLAVPNSSVDPGLAVHFSRGSDQGYLGLHWRLGTSMITRRGPLGGFATGTEDDRYFLDGRELIQLPSSLTIPGEQRYSPRDGGAEAVVYESAAGAWTVQLGGTTQGFGGGMDCGGVTSGPTVASAGSPYTPTIRQTWRLCRTQDDRGNAILYQYDAMERLTRVAWGEAASSPDPSRPADQRTHQLVLDYTTVRRDPLLVAGVGGMALHDTLLSSIAHRVSPTGQDHQVERSWQFDYVRTQPAGRTLLSEVWLHGAPDDDGVVRASQRLRQFHYRSEHASGDFDEAAVQWQPEVDLSGQFTNTEGWRMRTLRANHDALPDVLFLDVDEEWKDPSPPVCEQECSEPATDPCVPTTSGIDCFDPTDSAYEDVCVQPIEVRLFINTGGLQFVEDPVAAAVIQSWVDQQVFEQGSIDAFVGSLFTVDLNGDGMHDLVGPTTTLLSPPAADWRALGSSSVRSRCGCGSPSSPRARSTTR